MADFGNMKVAELRAECEARGLDTHGLKADLVARLEGGHSVPGTHGVPSAYGAPVAHDASSAAGVAHADMHGDMVDYEDDGPSGAQAGGARRGAAERGSGSEEGGEKHERPVSRFMERVIKEREERKERVQAQLAEPIPEGFYRTSVFPLLLWRPVRPLPEHPL